MNKIDVIFDEFEKDVIESFDSPKIKRGNLRPNLSSLLGPLNILLMGVPEGSTVWIGLEENSETLYLVETTKYNETMHIQFDGSLKDRNMVARVRNAGYKYFEYRFIVPHGMDGISIPVSMIEDRIYTPHTGWQRRNM